MEIRTRRLLLRTPEERDVDPLTALLAEPEVARWWHHFDRTRVKTELVHCDEEDLTVLVIERDGLVIGAIQFFEEPDLDYRHASIDLFLGSSAQGLGLGTEAIAAVVEHLIRARGHHRLVIDPSAANTRAIRAYEKVGFRKVGIMREYERGPDGTFHDGLLMELLAGEYVSSGSGEG